MSQAHTCITSYKELFTLLLCVSVVYTHNTQLFKQTLCLWVGEAASQERQGLFLVCYHQVPDSRAFFVSVLKAFSVCSHFRLSSGLTLRESLV